MLFMHMLQVLFIYAVAVVADAVYAYAAGVVHMRVAVVADAVYTYAAGVVHICCCCSC